MINTKTGVVIYCEPMRFNATDKKLTPLLIEGLPWFIGNEVCEILEIANSRDAIGRLDNDEKRMSVIPTPSGKQNTNIVNESGMYSLIFQSRKPEAKAFRKWVTSEVLPGIRRTGKYEVSQPVGRPHITRGELINAEIMNLLWLIGESLNRGDQKELAIELGVSAQSVNRTLNGYNRSNRILMALYNRARANREAYMLYHRPDVMAKNLIGDTELPAGNHMPAIKLTSKRGGALGNQNARKGGKA